MQIHSSINMKSRSRSRSRPRIFNGRNRSKSTPRNNRRAATADASSIGSELSVQDQFDIVVYKKGGPSGDRRSNSIVSYFTGEYYGDNSTVSSITTEDYQYRYGKGFTGTNSNSTSAAASWCCCSDTTQNTTTTAVDYNTLVQSEGDEVRAANALLMTDTVAPPRRPRIKFGSWRRGGAKKSEMSQSLFDALQEEDPYMEQTAIPVARQPSRRRSRSLSIFGKRSTKY